MKVYVDELPKSCEECPLRSYMCDAYWCSVYEGDTILFADEVKEANLCPLQPLTDHDKQVRKEVLEEIKSAIKEKLTYPDNRVDCPFDNGYPYEDTICSVLEQLQGE